MVYKTPRCKSCRKLLAVVIAGRGRCYSCATGKSRTLVPNASEATEPFDWMRERRIERFGWADDLRPYDDSQYLEPR